MTFNEFIANNFYQFWALTGFANCTWQHLVMLAVGLFFLWLAIKRNFEPMLLVPIGFGILIGNIPFDTTAGLEIGIYEEGSVLNILYNGVSAGWYPPLIFLGIGAMTDFSALIANPKLSSKLAPNLMGAIAVSAYSYMALVPLIQPPIMRLLTTKKERVIKMKPARAVSQNEKIIFPIVGLLLTCFVVPSGIPLLGMLFFGNLLRECGVTTRLAKTASNALTDIVTILLGMTVGASTQASEFLTLDTIFIFALGFMAFIIASASGVLFVKLFNLFLPTAKKLNPLIGNAGVSAVPMSARISNNLGLEYDPSNYLLMHAMGPNVSGVIGSAVAAGVLLGFLA